jgi:hemerythrin-like domain-containing protein
MIQIGAKPDSGFDDPIGMLKDCHRRIEHFLGILCLMANRAEGRALTTEEASAVQAALQYFRVGGVRHNADEEESLFPRLRKQFAEDAMVKIDSLEIDHRSADRLHLAIEQLYEAWMERGSLSSAESQQLLSATERMENLYKAHIAVEEEVIFPRAAALFSSADLASIGKEFRDRRL